MKFCKSTRERQYKQDAMDDASQQIQGEDGFDVKRQKVCRRLWLLVHFLLHSLGEQISFP